MRDQAIFNTHPTAVRIVASKDAYNVDKNLISLDESAIATELLRLEAEREAAEEQASRDAELQAIYMEAMPYMLAYIAGQEDAPDELKAFQVTAMSVCN